MLRSSPVVVSVFLLLATASSAAAEHTLHAVSLLEDPQPKKRPGPALRLGTAVGQTVFAGRRVSTLGGTLAMAWQRGRLSVEADYSYLALRQRIDTREFSANATIGRYHRMGLVGRVDIAQVGRHWVGDNTKLIFWLEGGAGVQRGGFITGERFQRTDAVAGMGWLLDHRFKRPLGFPSRVGWHFGWRVVRTAAPGGDDMEKMQQMCKALLCSQERRQYDLGLLVSSGLHFSW